MSAPPPRPSLAAVPAYVPGRAPTARADGRVYKLSSNENPYPPLPGIVRAAEAALEQLNRYPDLGNTALYEALSDSLGVVADRLAVSTGSVGVLYHLLQAYCESDDEVVHAWRSFEAYPSAIAVTGATGVPVPLTEDGRHDLDEMLAAITERTRVVILCTPNNPTGPALTHTEVARFCEQVPGDVVVCLDEAYRDFVRSDDPLDAVALQREHDHVVTVRTFAKASGLAGLRVGYAVAHPDVAAAIRTCSLPFGVSGVAQAAAVAALAHPGPLAERVETIVAERGRVVTALTAQGWTLPEAQGNFVWFPLGAQTAAFAATFDEAGLSVRPFDGDGVRVSIGEPDANDLLLAVAATRVPGGGEGGQGTIGP